MCYRTYSILQIYFKRRVQIVKILYANNFMLVNTRNNTKDTFTLTAVKMLTHFKSSISCLLALDGNNDLCFTVPLL